VPLALHRQLYRGGYKTVLTCGDIKDCPSDSQVHWLACNAAIIVTKLLESHLFRRDYLRMPCPSSATSQQFDMVVCCRLLIKVLSESAVHMCTHQQNSVDELNGKTSQMRAIFLSSLVRGATIEMQQHLMLRKCRREVLSVTCPTTSYFSWNLVSQSCRTPNWCFVRSSRLPLQSSSTNDILANALLTSLPAKI